MRDGLSRRLLGVVFVSALLTSACGDSGAFSAVQSIPSGTTQVTSERSDPPPPPTAPDRGDEAAGSTEPEMTSATTTAPGSDPRPILDSIAVIGDSMSVGLAAPLRAALENDTRQLDWRWWVGLLTPAPTHVWDQLLEDMRPDVVVVFFAPWESKVLKGGGVLDAADPEWARRYHDEFVAPLIERVRSSGSRLVWVGMPNTRDDHSPASHAELNAVWRGVIEQSADAAWVDGPLVVGGPNGEYREFDEKATSPVRLINSDGLHLCPPATERIAEEVLGRLAHEFQLDANDDWRSTDWADHPGAFGPEGCEQAPDAF